jgi:hypothetical protein
MIRWSRGEAIIATEALDTARSIMEAVSALLPNLRMS